MAGADNNNPESVREGANSEFYEEKKKLEELNRFKTYLIAFTSHQLRAPLATIKGYAAILRQGLYGDVNEKIGQTLEKIEFAADDLISLVNNLIDMRKVEEGRMDYIYERVDFVELTKDAAESLHLLAMHKNLEFEVAFPAQEIFVSADAQKIRHVVQNLVDNSIKYTKTGFVKVEIKATDHEAIFSVKDSGIGIGTGLLPRVFEEFIRDERVKKEIVGSGIGLYIAKEVVTAHDGKIWAESDGEGKGSMFSFSLKKV